VPQCDRPNRALGLCRLHVQRAYAHGGNPLAGRWTPAIPAGAEGPAPLDLERTYDPPAEIDPEPLRQLRGELQVMRHGHVPFEVAWPLALAILGPALNPWRAALAFALPEWRAAYMGEPPVMVFGVPDPWRPAPALEQAIDDLAELYD